MTPNKVPPRLQNSVETLPAAYWCHCKALVIACSDTACSAYSGTACSDTAAQPARTPHAQLAFKHHLPNHQKSDRKGVWLTYRGTSPTLKAVR